MSLTDPNFSIASKLGELSVTNLELRNLHAELNKAKENILEKDNFLKESLVAQEVFTQQVISAKGILTETKHSIFYCSIREIKKLKEHFIQVEDVRKLTTSFLANLQVLYENLGDKPLQAQNSINFLNSRTKTQLQFEQIQNRKNLIAQAKKDITKEKMLQDTIAKEKYMLSKIDDFKVILRDVFEHDLPNFWDEQGLFLSENEYQEGFQ